MNDAQNFVVYIIARGTEDKPVPLADVAADTGINYREVKSIIQELRRNHGTPIGTSRTPGRSGYWIITCPNKLRDMAGKIRHEGLERLYTASKMEETADAREYRIDKQVRMFE